MVDTFVEDARILPAWAGVRCAGDSPSCTSPSGILDFVTPYHVGDQLGEKDNTALGLSITGYFLGVIIVFVAVLYTPVRFRGRVPVASSTPTSGTTCWRSSSTRSAP